MTANSFRVLTCVCVATSLLTAATAHGDPTPAPPASETTPAKEPPTGKPTPKKSGQKESQPTQEQVTPKEKSAATQPVGRPPEQSPEAKPPEIAPIFEQPGILTPRRTLVLEPSFQYSLSSTRRIALIGYTYIPAITIGFIDVRSVTRHTYVTALAARYGLTNRLEVEARVPYIYQSETSTTRPFTQQNDREDVFDAEGNGIGDVEFGLRYQLNQPSTGPYFTASLRAKAPTGKNGFEVPIDPATNLQTELPRGSGFWAVQGGLTALFPSDPAVFFGGVSYTWNIERNVGVVNGRDFGTIDPGDVVEFNFGMGLAINEKASFSIGYDHSIIGKTRINNQFFADIQNTYVGTLLFGYSYKLFENTNINLSLGVGVTEAAPDVQLTLRVPVSF
ncbi:transporter [Geobacter sp.]|uniref:transporter n=1 Tax=Geobacter sp. TaxID=46610 RepID=UPI00261239F9|nr:transporter [Geobacter sp.]